MHREWILLNPHLPIINWKTYLKYFPFIQYYTVFHPDKQHLFIDLFTNRPCTFKLYISTWLVPLYLQCKNHKWVPLFPNILSVKSALIWVNIGSGPIFCLLLGVSSDCAQPITGQVTEVTCPVIGRAQPELTPSKRQKTGPGNGLVPDGTKSLPEPMLICFWRTIPQLHDSLAVLSVQFGHGWLITSHRKMWNTITYPCHNTTKRDSWRIFEVLHTVPNQLIIYYSFPGSRNCSET